jgi:outer membrane protein assembly factor BamB
MQKLAKIIASRNKGDFLRAIALVLLITLVGVFFFRILPVIRNLQSDVIFNPRAQDFFNIAGFVDAPPIATKITSIYRNGANRTGEYKIDKFHLPIALTYKVGNLFGGIHTASKATPAVDPSGIYFGTDLGIFYKFSLDGKLIWSFQTEAGQQGIHGTALVDEENVFFGNYNGNFYCLKKNNGALVWSTTIANAAGSSPLMYKEKIIFSAEFSQPLQGYAVALDRRTGKKIWVSEYFEEQVHSSPTLDEANGIIGVGSNTGVFWGLDVETGQTLWRVMTDGPIKGTAIFYKGQFCFGSWDKSLNCVSSHDGKKLFSVSLEAASQSSPALDEENQLIYASSSSGSIYKISLESQKILLQNSLGDVGVKNRYSVPSPIIIKSKNRTYLVSSCEKTKVCFFNASDLRPLQKIEVGGFVSGSFVVNQDAIFFNVDNQGLVRLN